MTDIVERLRSFRTDPTGCIREADVLEAADEIERLRSVVETREVALRQLTKDYVERPDPRSR